MDFLGREIFLLYGHKKNWGLISLVSETRTVSLASTTESKEKIANLYEPPPQIIVFSLEPKRAL